MTDDGGGHALGAPRFDVVLRGYDRRQVDEHVARLDLVVARMRADLDAARMSPFPGAPYPVRNVPYPGGGPGQQGPGPQGPGGRPRPTPRPRPNPDPNAESPDMIDGFTDRMQSILQAAEDEAAEIRNRARAALSGEEDAARARIAELARQRDAVLGELRRVRGQLDGMLTAPMKQVGSPDNAPPPTRPRDAAVGQPLPGTPAAVAPRAATGGQAGPAAPGPVAPARPPVAAPADPNAGVPSAAVAKAAAAAPAPVPPPPSTAESVAATTVVKAVTKSPPAKTGPAAPLPVRKASESRAAATPAPPGTPFAGTQPRTERYPATAEPLSMCSRSEPQPEPGELFRPVSEGPGGVEYTVAVPAAGSRLAPRDAASGAPEESGETTEDTAEAGDDPGDGAVEPVVAGDTEHGDIGDGDVLAGVVEDSDLEDSDLEDSDLADSDLDDAEDEEFGDDATDGTAPDDDAEDDGATANRAHSDWDAGTEDAGTEDAEESDPGNSDAEVTVKVSAVRPSGGNGRQSASGEASTSDGTEGARPGQSARGNRPNRSQPTSRTG